MNQLRAIGFVLNGIGIGIGMCTIANSPVLGCIVLAFNLFATAANWLGMKELPR